MPLPYFGFELIHLCLSGCVVYCNWSDNLSSLRRIPSVVYARVVEIEQTYWVMLRMCICWNIEVETIWPLFYARHKNMQIDIQILLKFVFTGPTITKTKQNKTKQKKKKTKTIKTALIRINFWRQIGNNYYLNQRVLILLTYVCITRPEWVKNTAL